MSNSSHAPAATRVVTSLPVEFEFTHGRRLTGSCAELSTAGMFIRSFREPPIDAEVTVYVCMIGMVKEKIIQGVVRWVRRGQGFGVEFRDLPLETVYVLMTCIAAIDQVMRPTTERELRPGRR